VADWLRSVVPRLELFANRRRIPSYAKGDYKYESMDGRDWSGCVHWGSFHLCVLGS
jgi:hypothetical protein